MVFRGRKDYDLVSSRKNKQLVDLVTSGLLLLTALFREAECCCRN